MSEEGEGGFLARWSRRKREAVREPEAEPAPDAVAPPDPPVAAGEAAACPAPEPEPEFDLASLPKLEELTTESDLSAFLRPGVPAALRTAALRRMWSLDPAIRDFIGCVDYQWDFNTPGGLPFGFASELGGDVKKLLAQAIGKLEELEAEERDAAAGAESADAAAPPGATEARALPAETDVALPAPGHDDGREPDALGAEPMAAVPAPPPAAPPAITEPPAVPRRRHGGALPG